VILYLDTEFHSISKHNAGALLNSLYHRLVGRERALFCAELCVYMTSPPSPLCPNTVTLCVVMILSTGCACGGYREILFSSQPQLYMCVQRVLWERVERALCAVFLVESESIYVTPYVEPLNSAFLSTFSWVDGWLEGRGSVMRDGLSPNTHTHTLEEGGRPCGKPQDTTVVL